MLLTFLTGFIVYLDIILKIVYSSVGELHAMGDFWWLIIMIAIFIFYIFCSVKDDFMLHVIAYIVSFIPIVVLIAYLINLEPVYSDADWKLVLTYMLSEIFLLIPVYILQLKKIIKIYKNEI